MENMEVAKDLEIPRAMTAQNMAIERLEQLVEQLSVKIQPILRSEPTGEGINGIDEKQSTVSLVNDIVGKTRNIERISDKLETLSGLCEC